MLGPASVSFACVRCWKQKKKCDRAFPECGRCAQRRVFCTYSSEAPTSRVNSVRPRASGAASTYPSPARRESDPDNDLSHRTPGNSSSISPILATNTGAAISSLSTYNLNRHDLSARVSSFFNQNAVDIKAVCIRYFATLHKFLPCVSEAEVWKSLSQMESGPDAEMSVLLLSMYLVTHGSTSSSASSTEAETTYIMMKTLYSQLQLMNKLSLTMVQAGLLISIYENSEDLNHASYMSIGACVRLGHAIGLHKTLQQTPPVDYMERMEMESRKRVWWGVIILERIFGIQDVMGRPLASQSLRIDDNLPIFGQEHAFSDEAPIPVGMSANNSSKLSRLQFPVVNSYARSAQAAYLIGRVFDHITKGPADRDTGLAEAVVLDEALQRFTIAILEQAEHDRHGADYCGPYSISIGALLALHQYELSQESLSDLARNHEFSRASLALSSVIRIIGEVIKSKFGEDLQGGELPPWFALHGIKLAALLHVNIGYSSTNEKQWKEELQLMISYLRQSKDQWKIAGRYLKDVEEALIARYGSFEQLLSRP